MRPDTVTIDASQTIYSFSAAAAPRAALPLGQPVWIETRDCYGDQLTVDHTGAPVVLAGINPATGPFAVPEARAGDTLVVEVQDIEVADRGTMNIRPQAGLYGELLTHAEVRKIPLRGGMALLPGSLRIPVRPMIGVIGVAPAAGAIPTGRPGRHGGNMDTRLITAGATLYLPVAVDGALFALGDLHAAMADGESGICGVEIAGRVLLRLGLVKQKQEPWPVLETDGLWSVIAAGEDLDMAAREAGMAMLTFILRRASLDKHDIVRLLSVAGHLQISQVVNPLKTVRMTIEKESLRPHQLRF